MQLSSLSCVSWFLPVVKADLTMRYEEPKKKERVIDLVMERLFASPENAIPVEALTVI